MINQVLYVEEYKMLGNNSPDKYLFKLYSDGHILQGNLGNEVTGN